MAAAKSQLKDVRKRLKSGKLNEDDKKFIDFFLVQAEREGLGDKVGNRRVVARLPSGMDIVK